jgi:DNA-directed RNA polymerase subunit beta'
LIPAGTGGATQQMRAIATERDNVVVEARRIEAEAAAALAAPAPSDDVVGGDVFKTMPSDEESRD